MASKDKKEAFVTRLLEYMMKKKKMNCSQVDSLFKNKTDFCRNALKGKNVNGGSIDLMSINGLLMLISKMGFKLQIKLLPKE